MSMTVGDLLTLIEDLPPNTELRVAHQPSWPLALTISTIRTPDDTDEEFQLCPDHPDYYIGHIISPRKHDPEHDPPFICDTPCPSLPDPEDDTREGRQHVWIVAIDHPYNESPYAPRWVFEED